MLSYSDYVSVKIAEVEGFEPPCRLITDLLVFKTSLFNQFEYTSISWWRRWDSNPRPSECKSDALANWATTPSDAQQQYRWLSASLRLDKMTATLNGRMANVVGYFVPLHSLTTLATHMYIFECCLRPTSGCELLGRRISKSRPLV